MNDNKQNQNPNQQQQNHQQRPKDLEPQGEQKGAQQVPSSQRERDDARK